MEGAILHTDSDKDLQLILILAKKLGIHTRKLTTQEMEDLGLLAAVKDGETGEYVSTEDFLNDLRDGGQD